MVDELLDLVDRNDSVIGQALRSEIYQKNYRIFVLLMLF